MKLLRKFFQFFCAFVWPPQHNFKRQSYKVFIKTFINCSSIILQLSSQIITFEHEGNWSKALEYYDLQVRSEPIVPASKSSPESSLQREHCSFPLIEDEMRIRKPYKGLIRSLQQLGCTHVLDLYSQGLTSRKGRFQHDFEFTELQVYF